MTFSAGSVSIFSGKNGNDALLASSDLQTGLSWQFRELSFAGLAKSVAFTGDPLFFTGFDDVTLGLDTLVRPVPEPAALGVFGLGLLLMGCISDLRRRCH